MGGLRAGELPCTGRRRPSSRVVADSHALVWFTRGSSKLSTTAAEALRAAEASEGVVVSVATLIDLWYVAQTTQGVSVTELADLRRLVGGTSAVSFYPVDTQVADACTGISRDLLRDPWDRLIVATALSLHLPLVTRDGPIRHSGLVETVW